MSRILCLSILFVVLFVNKDGSEPKADAFGRKAIPLELKILSTLRILGRGSVFDDAHEGSGMSEESCRSFFHSFCEKFAVDLFDMYVHPPQSPEEIKSVMNKYESLGLPGAIGSVDCTHIRWDMCPASLAPSFCNLFVLLIDLSPGHRSTAVS